ncbi:MAG: hypothetical protein KIT25_20405 [Enhydrobacter sp.]|nr:MAG: hypothetical protein KIT25_20405 [Enhydrobacter sp.]
MSDREFMNAVFASLLERATPRLHELLQEHGVQHLSELPHDVMTNVRQQAILQTVLTENPLANADALRQTLQSLDNPQFLQALRRLKSDGPPADAFEPTAGMDAAILFSGLGLPVCPFDRFNPAPIGAPSSSIEEVARAFAKRKSAYVAYSPNLAPFYLLVTDCHRTLAEDGVRHPALAVVRDRVEEAMRSENLPPTERFRWAVIALPRMERDRVPHTIIENPRPDRGSFVLYAGWVEDGEMRGGPTSGYVPIPKQFLQVAATDPFAMVIIRSKAQSARKYH